MPPARSRSSEPSSSRSERPCVQSLRATPAPPASAMPTATATSTAITWPTAATSGVPRRCTPTPISRLHQSRLMESVADAADGLDEVGGVAELLAQALDVDVDRPLQDHRVLADGGIHQLEPREGAPRLTQEHFQETELGRGQGQLLIAIEGSVAVPVDHHPLA